MESGAMLRNLALMREVEKDYFTTRTGQIQRRNTWEFKI